MMLNKPSSIGQHPWPRFTVSYESKTKKVRYEYHSVTQ